MYISVSILSQIWVAVKCDSWVDKHSSVCIEHNCVVCAVLPLLFHGYEQGRPHCSLLGIVCDTINLNRQPWGDTNNNSKMMSKNKFQWDFVWSMEEKEWYYSTITLYSNRTSEEKTSVVCAKVSYYFSKNVRRYVQLYTPRNAYIWNNLLIQMFHDRIIISYQETPL